MLALIKFGIAKLVRALFYTFAPNTLMIALVQFVGHLSDAFIVWVTLTVCGAEIVSMSARRVLGFRGAAIGKGILRVNWSKEGQLTALWRSERFVGQGEAAEAIM